jgi:hypothetical protein
MDEAEPSSFYRIPPTAEGADERAARRPHVAKSTTWQSKRRSPNSKGGPKTAHPLTEARLTLR